MISAHTCETVTIRKIVNRPTPECPFVILCSCSYGPHCKPEKTPICFLSLQMSLHFLRFYISGILKLGLIFLTTFIRHDYFEVHPCCSMLNRSCFLLHCMHIPQLFIQSPLDGYLGHFQLEPYNKAAITFVYKSYMDSIQFLFSWINT